MRIDNKDGPWGWCDEQCWWTMEPDNEDKQLVWIIRIDNEDCHWGLTMSMAIRIDDNDGQWGWTMGMNNADEQWG